MTSAGPWREADGAGGPDTGNAGVYFSGNTFHGPVAQGNHAHAVQVNQGAGGNLARLERALEQLAAGIREAGGDHADDALDDVDRVQDELHRRTPDRGRMIQLLERITAVVTPVSGLLEVADHARELISLIPH
jgi:hypothetical protein